MNVLIDHLFFLPYKQTIFLILHDISPAFTFSFYSLLLALITWI